METQITRRTEPLLVGIDIGSTTTKIAAVEPETGALLYSDYRRHHAAQAASVVRALEALDRRVPGRAVRLCLTGSGAKPLADALGVSFVQEVVANSVALRRTYQQLGTAIELGGQDAKIIFFRRDEASGQLVVSDMRMNGSCAGGTGAFIDEVASILKTPVEDFNALAESGRCVYDISGRCGVYAKTDIQPLLNQGVDRGDLALSSFHAIAKQTIGGLAQGLRIEKPVVFEGGPLTFNPALIQVFAQRLGLKPEEILVPKQPELMVAYGAALFLQEERFCAGPARAVRALLPAVESARAALTQAGQSGVPFFTDGEEKRRFLQRHARPAWTAYPPRCGETVRAYLGIDSGSTTTKFVLLDEDERILDQFYAPNGGQPLYVARDALVRLRDRYRRAGAELELLAVGSTGYGELLFHHAFQTECHVVETVAHARAAEKYVRDATFLLDIGGQDMKAIWLDRGIITKIVVNEACSSGCGSFLENFAQTLHIPVQDIAQAAFSSQSPAVLGSRCTVFMNSSVITEQRSGKRPEDIMAGLCRSIIENVFTKVIRVSNLDSLGSRVVVQGGTFENDAVLRAMEQYLGRQVLRAPYPGVMGAIGAALAAKERRAQGDTARTFIGLDALDSFSYTQRSDLPCPFCANHCKRTVIQFSSGAQWVTNNRCERGEILGDPADEAVRLQVRSAGEKRERTPDLFRLRERLVFQEYDCAPLCPARSVTVGIPRVLSFWDTAPFWTTLWRSLGFRVVLSGKSTRALYESGLSAVTSDTVCFPAKLVHGHLRDLAGKGVDRIFMPSVTALPSENTEKTSQSMCAVVKGYPLVIRNSDDPGRTLGVPLDAPLFHWYTEADRDRQLARYLLDTFGIPKELTQKAIAQADRAQKQFRAELKRAGQEILDEAARTGKYAVVLASRPYQNDPLVNHELPGMFTRLGIPVLTADSLPGAEEADLSRSRIDVANNFHARMLSTAILAARSPQLEYVQLVSFGCGHDAYLSDEITRMMKEISGKVPLVLKVDESDIQGPLSIRVRSFVETVERSRRRKEARSVRPLQDPYPVKYTRADRKERVVLIPNTSHAFSRLMAAAFASQGIRTQPLELGREEAIRLGKQYVHNDICFPAQIVIGEALAALKSGRFDGQEVAVGMGKYVGDCRLTHYTALLRKALDDAGFSQVPILTNDDVDYHNIHPGFRMKLKSAMIVAFGLPMIDALEALLRKLRPYELEPGSADRAFDRAMDEVIAGIQRGGIPGAARGFERAIGIMQSVRYDRSRLRPGVLIVGEYLLNFHPGANHDIENYLERNGFEIIEAHMTDVIRKTYFTLDAQTREYHLRQPLARRVWYRTANLAFELAHRLTDRIASRHPLYERPVQMQELVRASDRVIHHTFDTGEGVLIPAEILHHAKNGCRSFVVLQPFGCLPNHVVGRGVIKKLKELYPGVQILPLDYDPDVSFANVENRLQMLVVSAAQTDQSSQARQDGGQDSQDGQGSQADGVSPAPPQDRARQRTPA